MKFYRPCFLLLIFIPTTFISFSCLNSPESVYNRMLNKYESEKGGNITLMAEKFLLAFSKMKTEHDNLFFNQNLILSVKGNDIEIIYPEDVKIKGDESIGENFTFADINKNSIVLGNNKGFCVFDLDGDPQTVYKSEKRESIDALGLNDKNVVYLSAGKMFELSCSEKKVKRMDPGEYHSPYKKFFRSSIVVSDRFIILATGIAGLYYINIFDSGSGNVLMKNISAASSELSMNENFLSYVRGGTGSWSVEKYELPSKKRSQISRVGKIDNIFIGRDGFITLSGKKYLIEGFNGEKGIMPQDWNILGICRNVVLIEYGKIVYILDFPKLLKKIIEMNKKMGENAA